MRQIAPGHACGCVVVVVFASLISAFVKVKLSDYRPTPLKLSNLESGAADLCRLPFVDNSIPSLSYMHVIEHVGLGRYGDLLNPEADATAFSELARVLTPGGHLLVAVPVGRPRVCFNAHRVYSYKEVVAALGTLKIREFALLPDTGDGLQVNASPETVQASKSMAGGCFWFQKPRGPN